MAKLNDCNANSQACSLISIERIRGTEAGTEGSHLLFALDSFDWLPPETLGKHQMNVEIGH